MKKVISVLLILLLLPVFSLLTACKKEEGYLLSHLKNDLLSIADKYETVIIEDDNLKFSYATLKEHDDTKIEECIESVEPYKNIERYNDVFYNLMDFAFDYVGICSNDSFDVSVEYRNNLKVRLDALDSAIQLVDINIQNLAEILNYSADESHTVYIERLDTVLNSYNKVFIAGQDFTNAIADMYFNQILIGSNPDISQTEYKDFESSVVINTLDARTKSVISLLTQNYIETYLSKENMVDELLTKDENGNYTTLDLTVNKYGEKVASLKVLDLTTEENVNKAVEIANTESKRADFYENAIQAYHLQEMIENDRDSYSTASQDIDYLRTKDYEKATNYDKVCIKIIDNYGYLMNQYADVLNALLELSQI